MFKEKIAVFDLDDTLYVANSHIEILCQYYKTKIFKSLIFKVIGKLSCKIERMLLYHFYNKIPENIKNAYLLKFNTTVLELLQKKQKDGYFILILSNAPIELLIAAAEYLRVDYLQAKPFDKANALNAAYKYKSLFVCTDNTSDIDLLSIADEAVITCKEKNKKYFIKNLVKKNYTFFGEK
jgi:phosphoserine phosphatase